MALARKCDRCGRLYEFYNEPNAIRTIHVSISGSLCSKGTPMDLCRDCMNEYTRFINMED